MTGPAQDAYHAYHVHLGTVRTAPPFEELPMREQDAWKTVAGVTADHLEQIESAEQERRRAENRLDDERVRNGLLQDRIAEIEEKLKAAEAAQKLAEAWGKQPRPREAAK